MLSHFTALYFCRPSNSKLVLARRLKILGVLSDCVPYRLGLAYTQPGMTLTETSCSLDDVKTMDVLSESNGATRRLLQFQRMLSLKSAWPSLEVFQKPVQSVSQSVLKLNHNQKTEDDVPYPLTEAEAYSFLENVLGINKPRELLHRDRSEFIDTVTLLMNKKVPFTNIPMLSENDLVSMTCPTLLECKEAVLKLHGGNCVYINIFMKGLLDVLGFKTFHVGANNPGDSLFDTHVATILCDLTYPGSRHLVDPGTIRPLYTAIPLDFEKESPIYHFNYMKVKFFKRDHGILHSCSQVPEPETPSPNILEIDGHYWKVELTYRLHVPRSRAYWLNRMKHRYHFPTLIPHIFHNIGLFGHIGDKCVILGSSGEMLALKYQHSDPSQVEMMFLPRDEYFALMEKEFPQFSRKMIENALVNARYVRNMYNY